MDLQTNDKVRKCCRI